MTESPYQQVLGGRFALLHPRLRDYFRALTVEEQGVGHGVFSEAGSPRRMMQPFLRLLQFGGVAFPGWHHDVPFVVINRAAAGGDGSEVRAARRFSLPHLRWTMRDRIRFRDGELIEDLGRGGWLRVHLRAAVDRGDLHLESTRLRLRLGTLFIDVPRGLAPVVHLHEWFDESSGRQRVRVTVTSDTLGRIFEYAGNFTYTREKRR